MTSNLVNRMDTKPLSPRLQGLARRQRGRSVRDVLVVVLYLTGALGGLLGLVSI